ncbi:MAG: hypothetical protein AAF367_07215 [Pseudomonadota bacterium]
MTGPPEADDAPAPPGDDGDLIAAKRRDAALILPLAGLALLTPPVIGVFGAEAAVLGVPLIVVYLFGAWAGLIVCAAFLSRRLMADTDPGPGG